MNQTQSEGTAGDRQRRRRLKPDGLHLPLHLKFTWSKYAAWNPASHIEISQRAAAASITRNGRGQQED